MKRRDGAAGASTSATPRCLHLRRVPAVWGDYDADHLAARMRWESAAARSGMSGAARRFNWHLTVSEAEVERLLWWHNMTAEDLPDLAAEARAAFPDLFDRGWVIAHRADLDERERVLRLANLAP